MLFLIKLLSQELTVKPGLNGYYPYIRKVMLVIIHVTIVNTVAKIFSLILRNRINKSCESEMYFIIHNMDFMIITLQLMPFSCFILLFKKFYTKNLIYGLHLLIIFIRELLILLLEMHYGIN